MKRGDLTRWKEGLLEDALGARAAQLVEAVREVPPLPPEALARIRARVLARGRGRRAPLVLRLAMLAVVLLASVTTARATMILWQRHRAAVAARTVVDVPVAPARPRPRAVLPPPEPPRPVRPPASHPRRMAAAAPVHKEAPPPETEAQLLAGALARLRQAHDPAGALAQLDRYSAAYPHGVLEAEAGNLRLEAALQLDDRRTALRLLDARREFVGRLGAQQLLTRAELRASAGRYTDALADFDRLLGPGGAPADLERALYGRAVCLGHLGRDDRARADLTAYQQRFPTGKYAAEVARLLAGGNSTPRP